MRIYLLALHVVFFITKVSVASPVSSDSDLAVAIKKYQTLEKELDLYLKNKIPTCDPTKGSGQERSYCSIKDICSNPDVLSDNPYIYQNASGEKIVNENFYKYRNELRICFKEKYMGEIKQQRDEYARKINTKAIVKKIAANKKLNMLVDKFKEGAKVLKISSEILNISLQAGLNNEWPQKNEKKQTRSDINVLIKKVEKKLKLALNPKVRKALIDLQVLMQDDLYIAMIDQFEESLIPTIENKDPLYNFKLLLDEKAAGGKKTLEENRARLTKKTQEAYGIFEETQKEMVNYLESIKNAKNKDTINRAILRVQTIRFSPPYFTDKLSEHCRHPNAFYESDEHKFTICPQMLDFPKINLIETMAHEMAHSFDTCDMSKAFFKSKLPPTVEGIPPFDIKIETAPISGSYKCIKIEDLGEVNAKNILQDKLSYQENPFLKTINCLQNSKSVGAEVTDLGSLREKAQKKLAELTRLGQNNTANPEARRINFFLEAEREYFKYSQGCSLDPSPYNLQTDEAFADKIASEIVAGKMKKMNKSDSEKSFLQMVLSFGDICTNEGHSEKKLRDFAINEECPSYFENLDLETKIMKAIDTIVPQFDSHPGSALRAERIYLAHPEIRKALNCPSDQGIMYCE